jgi:alpha-1,3-rhamnosyl/mannosyltransferase
MYEGFGLPILEAMAAGAPIITSSLTSMPEVAGNAALFVDPEDPASIKEAMRTIYLNEPVKFQMRELGAQRLKAFTWERAAESTVAVYRQALAEA